MCGAGTSGAGAARTSRNRVSGLLRRPNRATSRAPATPAEGETRGEEELGEAQRPSRPRSSHSGQTFRAYLAWAHGMVTEKLAHAELQAHSVGAPQQIGHGPCIPAVDPGCLYRAERAGHRGLGRGHVERHLGSSLIDVARLQSQRRLIGQEAGKKSQNRCRNKSRVLLR